MIRPRSPSLSLAEFLALRDPAGDFSVSVDGVTVGLTHLERVYFPRERITKHEVLRYYARVWPLLRPFLFHRPAILKRFPRGVSGPPFFQHDLREAPPWLMRAALVNREGRTIHYAVYRTLADLLYLVNAGALEQHAWLSSIDALDRPVLAAIDLDPGKEVAWRRIEELALVARDVLTEVFGVRGEPKTSGSRGLHVFIPLDGSRTYEQLKPACRELARRISGRARSIATIERSLAKRDPKKIYVDLLQNARGKSIVAPWSLRVRPRAPVSMPLSWEAVERGVDPARFTIRMPSGLVEKFPDNWSGVFERRQSLSATTSRALRG
ncbi:MAG TPA: DNA primase small subunit domain-containing protein [Planctomycetota bacterium]|nr:DNA primase small subunit domain-containing protein [Planctomycetota bacterium]